ncbi:FAD:protein FMN transferase [Sedimentibacter sp. zth1]|uniref:FAD:protein FMN transferase n=1 Tax=Sedimentibacter sp. zth1 TaxID=2816908 RepID=UPI001A930B47|nr:FAD:protein FMN transferase [Sedimentibacter sp. zth1]QSX06213.1 FAD:protein FMN transferase [Sedimentibacter sp. zth1]
MVKKRIFSATIFILILSITTSCSIMGKDLSISRDAFMLDTLVTITIYGQDDQEIISGALNKISELENILSVHKEGSDLYNIRLNAGIQGTKVTDHTMNVIKRSMDYYKLTSNDYDITLGPVIELWKKSSETKSLPDVKRINELLKLVNSNLIQIDEDNNMVYVNKGMFIDFGAAAKGYIADQVKEYLIGKGVKNAIINLGGNVDIIGSKVDGSNFNIGIIDPFANEASFLGILNVSNTSIVTSGDYERYFEVDGKRYHHIINPKTGYPANSDLTSVSIVTNNGLNADILSTKTFILGYEKGIELIESLDGVEALFIKKDKTIYLTKGLKDRFKIVNDNYKIIN